MKSIGAALSLNVSVQDWQNYSPVPIGAEERLTETILDAFFDSNELVCCGYRKKQFATKTREEWRGQVEALEFVVPSPMSKVEGLTQDGKVSQRCLDNTGLRRFLVIECDKGPLDDQACILARLSEIAPLVLIVHSGGKSLHGWFDLRGYPEEHVRRFMEYAVKLGADPATWSRCQFVRMPDGMRDNGARQRVIYFNPSKIRRGQ